MAIVTTVNPTHERKRFARPGKVEYSHGVPRTQLYQWHKRGWIKLIQMRPPGSRRGLTLVDLDELEALIEKFRPGQEAA